MKFTKTSLASSFIRSFALVLALASLTTYVVYAGPFAANISGTNGSGVVTFVMNEGGADVNVVWEDATTFPMGTLAKGKTNFNVGPHTSWQIVCTKTGNGVPFLISSDANTNSNYANPRGVDVNKNPKIGDRFGRIYMASGGPGGFGFGTPNFHAQGIQIFNIDQSDSSLGRGTNASGIGAWSAPSQSDPWKLRLADDDSLIVTADSTALAAIYQFNPDLTSSNLVLGIVGSDAAKAAGVHADFFKGTPILTGSLAGGNLALYTGDPNLGAPGGTNCIYGPGTSPGSFNCLFRYDIGAGEYYVSGVGAQTAVATAVTNANTHLLSATPDQSRLSAVSIVPSRVAAVAVNPNSRLSTAAIGSSSVSNAAVIPSKLAAAAIIPSEIAAVGINTNSHLATAAVGPYQLASAAAVKSRLGAATVVPSRLLSAAVVPSRVLTAAVGPSSLATATVLPSRVATAALVTNRVGAAAAVANRVVSAAVSAGGSGYAVGDILTIASGTASISSTVTVASVSSGVITAVTVANAGNYTVAPPTPNTPITTTGVGLGAVLTLTFGTGTGYAVGDVLRIAGGTASISSTVTVSTVSSGIITAVTVAHPGNYSVLPATPNAPVTVTGTGSGANLTLTMGSGTNYAVGNLLTIAGGTASISATVTVTSVSSGVITAVSIANATNTGNYTVAPPTPNTNVTSTGTGSGAVLNLTLGTGTNYVAGDTLTITGGTGTSATVGVSSVGSAGVITAVTNKAVGSYSAAPGSPNSPSGGTGSGASLGLTMTGAGGSGYTAGDILTIAGGTASISATVTVASVSSGVITAVTVAHAGVYTTAPPSPNSPTGGTGTGASLTLTTSGTGNGYAVGDILTIAGGTASVSATVTVSAVSSGIITAVTVANAGNYTVLPPSPNTPITTTGTGSGASLTLTTSGTGTGYAVGDVLTIAGGTASVSATVTVSAVSSGIITAVTVANAGNYSVAPPTPNSPITTTGAGSGASLNLTLGTGTGYAVGDGLAIAGGTSSITATARVSAVSSGVITSLAVSNAGAYTVVPPSPNSPTGGTGTGASLTLTMTGAGGSGYAVNDVLTLTGGTGTSATVRVASVGPGGVITSITVVSNGNYSVAPASPNFPSGGFPGASGASLSLTFIGGGGSGYTAGDVLTLSGGTGSAGTVTVNTVNGSGTITAVSVTSAGSYTVLPPTPNSPIGGTGTGVLLNLTNGTGTGYAVGDVLTIAGGTASIAATVTVTAASSGVITAITVTNTGNYTVAPPATNSPTITSGTGSGAVLTLTMGTGTGYAAGNILTIAGGTASISATVTVASVSSGIITAVTLATAGTYTSPPPTPNLPIPTTGTGLGASLALTMTGAGGTNYTPGDILTIAGGTGTAATVGVSSVGGGGVITAVTNASVGNYSANPATPNSPTGGTGTGVRLNLTFIGGGGTGYAVGNLLTISGGISSISATATVTTVSSGVITGIAVTNTGNYTVAPPLTNTPITSTGTGSGAILNLTLGTGTNYVAGNLLTISGGTASISATVTVSTVSSPGGVITAVSIANATNAGNYSVAPPTPNSPTGGAGTGASLNLTMGSGTNYAVGNILTIVGGTGTPATVTVTSVSPQGAINGVSVASAGSYTASPSSPNSATTTNLGSGASLNLTMVGGGGSGYTAGDVLTISGGTGTPATVTVNSVTGGVIDSVTVTTPGSYTVAPTTPNAPTGGTGSSALLDLTFTAAAGVVGGSGYNVGDVLTVSGGTPSISATVTVASVTSGAITAVNVTYRGRYSVAPPSPNALTTVPPGTGSGASINLAIAGPLAWMNPPNYAYTMGLDGIAGLRTELELGKDGKVIAAYGRATSNPNIQILRGDTFFSTDQSTAGNPTNIVWTSWNETGGVGNDPWGGVNGSGAAVAQDSGVKVSPDGKYLASLDLQNGVTLAVLTNGVPDDGTIFGIQNAPSTSSARGMCWDAGDNIWISSSGQLLLRCYDLGLSTTCTTSNDFTGTNGSFSLIVPGVSAKLIATVPTASQNYINNTNAGQGPGTPIQGVFTISLDTDDLSRVGPVTVPFVRTGSTASNGVVSPFQYSMLSNSLLPNGVIITTTNVVFPGGPNPAGVGVNWSVDIPILPTPFPISGPSTTVSFRILAGNNYSIGVPFAQTVTILNTGPQLLTLSVPAATANMYRAVPGDYAKYTITRTGDLQGPGNGTNGVVARTYTVTNFNYYGTATNPLDYTALSQVQSTIPPYNFLSPPTNGGNTVVIQAGVVTVSPIVGNPVKHTNPAQTPTNLTIIVNLTNRVATPGNTNLVAQEGPGYEYQVSTATATLNELDNAIGASEVLLWSDALTNAADSVNWTLVFANTTFGPFSDRPPAVFHNYDNADHNNATNDFAVTFGKAVSDDLVPQSDLMAANGWNTALKMTVNKALGAEAGVNLYPQGINLAGNYALRFDMYLSLYQYASNNPGIGPPAREFAAFGINHRGTNCNWRLDVNPRPNGTGSGPTNWDGAWIAVDASSGSITPADYEVYRSPGLTNNAGGGAPGAALISVTATFVAGIFKHPPFSAINPTGGGEPANQWVAVSLETTAQTNVTLLINGQKIFAGSGAFALTNSPITATYSNGAPMLGYLDPNKSISDSSAFVYYSNVRAVELSPYILAQPNVVTNGVVTNAFNTGVFGVPTNVIHIITPGFSSLTFTSAATLGTAPITNRWFRGTGTIGSGIGTPSHTNALQTNVVAATSMNDRFTNTFNSLADGTNYMCLYSDAAGSITSTIVSVEVVFGPTSQTNNLGATTNLLVIAAGPSAPTAFQWYFNAASNAGPVSTWTKLANSAHLAGVTTANLFITNTLATDAGFYWCATTNAAGGIILEAAQMSVISPPSVAGVTPPNLVKFWGSTATFTVTNNGTAPFTYQWKRSGTNMVNGAVSGAANISGATTSALTLTGVTRNDAGNYSAAVNNPAGSIVSGIGTLSVLVPPSTVSSVSVSGGNATLAFTSPNPNDTSAAFILQSAGIVTGPYTNNAGGVFSGPVGGPFQVVVPTGAGDTLFYRLLHVQ